MIDAIIGNDLFSENLADELGCEFFRFKEQYYPDGEPCSSISAEYEDIRNRHVALVYRPVQPQTKLSMMSYLVNSQELCHNLKSKGLFGAQQVDFVMPYFETGRQFKKGDHGKDAAYETTILTLGAAGADSIITFEPHFWREGGMDSDKPFLAQDKARFVYDVAHKDGVNLVYLSAVPAMGRYFSEYEMDDDVLVVSPDKGSEHLANELAEFLHRETGRDITWDNMKKKRLDGGHVKTLSTLDTKGRDVIVVDDMITTGGTMKGCIEGIYNTKSVVASCVHPVLPQVGVDLMKEMLDSEKIQGVYATNTIDSEFAVMDVMPELVEYLLSPIE